MRLGVETLLNHYKILGLLGEGGMGEVYRAIDTTLKREVAIKVLSSRLAGDPASLARLEREAVVLAALNHPHIGAIHGLERTGDIRFLVLELVEGMTLADRLKAGPISVPEAMDIATQIADALEAAHEKGVIHRDLKPSNIKLTGGKVKVLDFGLAKALAETETTSPSDSPTISDTRAGVVMGTAAYMSPEQAEGRTVDKRTDVWAFAVVLYEMLTGQRLFDGKSTSHIIVHVMEQDPDWSKLPPLPSGVLDLLERCLQKDPGQRLRDIGDVKIQLRAAGAKPLRPWPHPSVTKDTSRRWLGVVSAITVLAVLVVGAAFYLRQPAPVDESPITLQIPRQSGETNAANVLSISPDGLRLAYAASTGGRSPQLWVRVLKTNEAGPLEGTDGVTGVPFWSSDSRYLFFSSADAKLKKIEAAGGPTQFLANVQTVVVSGFTLGEDKIIYGQAGRGLLQLSSKGGDPVPLFEGTLPFDLFPSLMPEGNVLYCGCGGANPGIYVALLNGGAPLKVLNDASSVLYAPTSHPDSGYILFLRGAAGVGTAGTLMAQEINPKNLVPLKDPFPIAEQVTNAGFSASTTGRLAYASGRSIVPLGIPGMVHGQMTWVNRDGKAIKTSGDPAIYRIPTLSADNKRVALETSDPKSQTDVDVQIFEFAGEITTRFTYHERRDIVPLWSMDGKSIVFTRLIGNAAAEIYRKPSDLSRDEELLFKVPAGQLAVANSWSADERFLLGLTLPAPAEIVAVDLHADARKLITLFTSPGNDINPRFSPDGKWFSYASNETGGHEIYVRPYSVGADGSPIAGSKIQASKGGAREGGAIWSARGDEMFYQGADGFLTSVKVTTVPTFKTLGPPKPLFPMPAGVLFFDVAKDAQSFLMPVPTQGTAAAPPYTVVTNWTSTIPK